MKLSKKITLIFLAMLSFQMNAQTLKVMTYNIRLELDSDGVNDWKHRKDFFTSQIQFYEPDFFGVQEATPNQVIDMTNSLPQYNHVGIGREGIGKGESSNIFFKKDQFTIIQESTFWLSTTPDTISKGWDAACHRVCTYALIKDKKAKKMMWVFNTHLDHIGEEARTKGIELILSRINKLNTKGYPVIFMGDFNSEPTEQRIINLKKQMIDCREVSLQKPFGPNGTFNAFQYDTPADKIIDYIFISENSHFIVNKYGILTDAKNSKYPSDHFPVYVELRYN